jgi:hypothetical protein
MQRRHSTRLRVSSKTRPLSLLGVYGSMASVDAANDLIYSFIVLQHDLYEVTVDLAVGYTLNAAKTHNPAFSVSVLTRM